MRRRRSLDDAADPRVFPVDDHALYAHVRQITTNRLPDAPVAADDDMVLHRRDFLFHAAFPPDGKEIAFHDHLSQLGEDRRGGPEAEHDDQHREDAPPGGQGVDFAEADGGQGDEGHVEPVEEGPAVLDDGVAQGAAHQDDQQQDRQLSQKMFVAEHDASVCKETLYMFLSADIESI